MLLRLLLFLLLPGALFAQTTSAYNFQPVEALVSSELNLYDGNAYLMVAQKGQLLYEKGWGSFTARTPRPIASATKLISGSIILALVDRGVLSLDDTVGRYLPAYTRAGWGGVTLRQLMSHTAGMPARQDGQDEWKDLPSLQAAADFIASRLPRKRPEPGFAYGGTSMQVAGAMAEKASDKTWGQLFQELIATPCQLTETSYRFPSQANPLIGGGALSTPADYLKLLEMIASDGVFRGTRVRSSRAIETLFADQTADAPIRYTPYFGGNPHAAGGWVRPVRYSIGAWLDGRNLNGSIRELSSPGLFGTHPWADRATGTYGILFTFVQNGHLRSSRHTLKVRAAIRQALGI